MATPTPATPTVTTIAPSALAAGVGATTLTVNGSGFTSTTTVQINAISLTTTYVSANQVTAVVPAAQLATGVLLPVNVLNGTLASSAVTLEVDNPTPSITQVSPTSVTTGSGPVTVTATGTAFISSTTIQVNGSTRPTTFLSPTQITASLTAADFVAAGPLAITAVNAGPGGGTSSPGSLPVNNAAPVITAIAPATALVGTAATPVTVTGSGFLPSTVIRVNGSARTTTVVSATQLTAVLTTADLASAGTLSVTAFTPSPGGGASGPLSLAVNNPVPAIIQLAPAALITGGSDTSVSVTGTGFVPTTVVKVGGSARITTYVSATQISVILTAADLSVSGSLSLMATNPPPAGGSSAAATVAVNYATPTIASFSPASLLTGTATPTSVTVTGTNFNSATYVSIFGLARSTTVLSSTQLSFIATVADQASATTLRVSVINPVAGGASLGVTASLPVSGPTTTPVITQAMPASFVVGSSSTAITVYGSGITTNSTVQWNGTTLPGNSVFYYQGSAVSAISIAVPATLLTAVGTASVTVTSPTATPSVSNALTVNITNAPAPTLTNIYPTGGAINTASAETLYGTGFSSGTTVALNGQTIPSTFVSSTSITANFPASALATPGNQNVTVTNPAPGGGVSQALTYTTFLSIANNDLVYNLADGLLYASVPASNVGAIGNCVVAIDPYTGTIVRQIQVGTKPNKLALSTDGTQLFVGLDGPGAVAQIDLAQRKVVNQFSLGGGPGIYNAPYTAAYIAAVPGMPNSVAVAATGQYSNGSVINIFDAGIARTSGSTGIGAGPLDFGPSASTLYLASSYLDALTVAPSGITKLTQLASLPNSNISTLQYDNGALYLSNGQVLNAASGTLNGTFYSSSNTPANGPVVSDSTLGRAFVAVTSFSSTAAVYVYDEASFNLIGTISVNNLGTQGYPTNIRKIVRWGQNGIALAAVPSAFTSNNQIYIFQSALVKDVSPAPADLAVTLTVPTTATTGAAISYRATVTNVGPNAAVGTTLAASLDPSLIINSMTASQGSCSTATPILCDVGTLASGTSATVVVNATPTNSGTISATAVLSSSSYDPTLSNNQAAASTTVTGSVYGAVPSVSSLSPSLVQAGAAAFTLTIRGNGFNVGSTVNLGGTALAATYVSSTQLNAAVPAAAISSYGWTPVSVSNPAPGGGVSSVVPLTIYGIVSVPASSFLFDPYGQSLYATVPSTATNITGNSVVAINPLTGAVGTPVPVGSQPTVMTETSDGNLLYIGLSGSSSLVQFNLLTQSVGSTIPIKYQSANSPALSLAALPGSDTTLAIGFSAFAQQFGIFDINGTTGSFRSSISGIYSGNNPVFASPTELYAYDSQTSGAEFYRYAINPSGLTLKDGTTLNGLGGFSGKFQLAAGLIYGVGGGIANPGTTPPSQLQTLPLIDFYGSGSTGSSVGVAADPSLQKEFLMLQNNAGTSAYGLVRYDLKNYLPEALLQIPSSLFPSTIQRFGQDGLALLSTNNSGGNTPVAQIVLVRGPFIVPQELSTSTGATLTASSASSIGHGAGNTTLTLTGSNFLPGVAVTWNGSYRTTTIVDATHVTVAIPASDLAAAGMNLLVATNPGAPASTPLTITIN